MDEDQNVKSYMDPFVVGDFKKCSTACEDMLCKGVASLHMLQFLLISLRFMRRHEDLKKHGDNALKITSEMPWDNALIRLTLGMVTLDGALETADNNDKKSQAYFYAGYRMLSQKKVKECLEYFEECLKTGGDTFEIDYVRATITELREIVLKAQ